MHNTNDDRSEGVNSCDGGSGPASNRLEYYHTAIGYYTRGTWRAGTSKVTGWVTGPVGATKISRVFRPPLSTVSRLTTSCAVNEGGTTWQCSGMKIGKVSAYSELGRVVWQCAVKGTIFRRESKLQDRQCALALHRYEVGQMKVRAVSHGMTSWQKGREEVCRAQYKRWHKHNEIAVVVVDVVPSEGKSSVAYSSRGLLALTGLRSRDGIAYREIQCVVNCLPTTAGENTLAVLQGQCAERAVQGGVPGKDVAFRAICAA